MVRHDTHVVVRRRHVDASGQDRGALPRKFHRELAMPARISGKKLAAPECMTTKTVALQVRGSRG